MCQNAKKKNLCIYLVTVATQIQTVSKSDGHCSHPDPVRMQSR